MHVKKIFSPSCRCEILLYVGATTAIALLSEFGASTVVEAKEATAQSLVGGAVQCGRCSVNSTWCGTDIAEYECKVAGGGDSTRCSGDFQTEVCKTGDPDQETPCYYDLKNCDDGAPCNSENCTPFPVYVSRTCGV